MPSGGVLAIGSEKVFYTSGKNLLEVRLGNCIVTSYGVVDADCSRIVLGDSKGMLYMLMVGHHDGAVRELKIEHLGRVSSPSSITYLDDGVLFVGSAYGDSQVCQKIVKLEEKR